MFPCRLCANPAPHVHVSAGVIAGLYLFPKKQLKLKLRRIRNVDFGVPAINYNGRWYAVPVSLVEQVWPLIRDRLARLRSAKDEHQDEDQDNGQDDDRDG